MSDSLYATRSTLLFYVLLITKTYARPSTTPRDIELIFIMPALVIVEHESEPTDVCVRVCACGLELHLVTFAYVFNPRWFLIA